MHPKPAKPIKKVDEAKKTDQTVQNPNQAGLLVAGQKAEFFKTGNNFNKNGSDILNAT